MQKGIDMGDRVKRKTWPLLRLVIPAFPEVNIFTGFAKKMTALGPIMVATAASKVWGWRVEVVDENNYQGPRDSQGLPDHKVLQDRDPATVAGFYCGLTSTIPRVWETAGFYRRVSVLTIAGGWHANYQPKEMLDNGIDIVVHGDGEEVIQQILRAVADGGDDFLVDIPGISFLYAGKLKNNPPEILGIGDLNDLPYPDFGLLRNAGKIKYYSIGRIRGCGMNCEFCSVKGKPRWSDARHLFETVNWLVETRKARRFFLVDDRSEGDVAGTIDFFRMISERYGNRLSFTVQMRLETAKNAVLSVMKKAGVRVVCIGIESPIDEELKAMGKGYSSANMLDLMKIWRSYGFRIHGMFMFGYPEKEAEGLVAPKEMVKRYKRFIRKSRVDTVQILHPVPLVGTALWTRLEGRIFPLDVVPWSRYDGNYVCFRPNNMSLREFQEIPLKLMKWFYSPLSFIRIAFKTIAFPVDCFIWGFERWHRHWFRDVVKYGGHRLIQQWQKKHKRGEFVERLEEHQFNKSDALIK